MQVTKHITVERVAIGLLVLGAIALLVGLTNKYCTCTGLPNLGDAINGTISDFYANITVDSFSVAFAILVLNRLGEQRAERELKAQLIREMGHPTDNGVALRAVRELTARGWLYDGTLRGADLANANLEGAQLQKADLQHAILDFANLKGANLEETNLQYAKLERTNLRDAELYKAQLQHALLKFTALNDARLVQVNLQNAQFGIEYYEGELREPADLTTLARTSRLAYATLPSGQKYDGRLNLQGDLRKAKFFGLDTNDPVSMAGFYQIPQEEYQTGQEWAHEHLTSVRRLAELDPDTGKALPSKNETVVQRERPRKGNRLKSSMVAHRIRRQSTE